MGVVEGVCKRLAQQMAGVAGSGRPRPRAIGGRVGLAQVGELADPMFGGRQVRVRFLRMGGPYSAGMLRLTAFSLASRRS
jgi:hypothetical protein